MTLLSWRIASTAALALGLVAAAASRCESSAALTALSTEPVILARSVSAIVPSDSIADFCACVAIWRSFRSGIGALGS